MINTIFFDFDGVITTDKKGSTSSANYISSQTTISTEHFLNHYRTFGPDLLTGKRNHRDIWAELCHKLEMELDYQLLTDSFIATPINTQMIQLIHDLKAANYQVGLITDNKMDRMTALIAYHNWHDLFDVLAISADVGSRKNQSAIFKYALDKGNILATEALFIDNTATNLLIPQDMGYTTLFFNDEIQDVELLRAELIQAGISF